MQENIEKNVLERAQYLVSTFPLGDKKVQRCHLFGENAKHLGTYELRTDDLGCVDVKFKRI